MTALIARGAGAEAPPASSRQEPVTDGEYRRGRVTVHYGKAEDCYAKWPAPVCIIADGPYGVSGFPGDLHSADGLAEWYRPHIEAWSEKASPQTTLWFWNSELGWATVHPVLAEFGWEYRGCHIWDKGLSHIAGNANTKTLRKFPVTTEACVQYVKPARFDGLSMRDWLRREWTRTGLPMRLANDACGVRNAATRKYLTADHLWYFPPPSAFGQMAAYANTHGDPAGRPYFSMDGKRPVNEAEWAASRAKFNCSVGVTNVWRLPHVSGDERVPGERRAMQWKFKSLHGSQKPLSLIELTIAASTDPGDMVWEPFGGLCPGAVSALRLGRACHSAEIIPEFYNAAVARLASA